MRRLTHILRLLLVLTPLACAGPAIVTSQPVDERETRPAALILDQVAELVISADKKQGKPVVIFDLDDTLFSTRPRNARIVREFGSLPEIQKEFGGIATKLATASPSQMRYHMEDSFALLGISDDTALQKAKAYWEPRFFSDEYCAIDEPITGAVAYVKKLHRLGAQIVYMSGRDEPRMKKGTVQSLKKHGFPLSDRTLIVLKPHKDDEDLKFKRDAMERIRARGQVVAVFENEPRNLNAFDEAFPKSVLVFLDTQHSRAPDKPTAEAHWVKDFLPSPDA